MAVNLNEIKNNTSVFNKKWLTNDLQQQRFKVKTQKGGNKEGNIYALFNEYNASMNITMFTFNNYWSVP